MMILTLLFALAQTPAVDPKAAPLPPEVVESLLKAGESVVAIAKSGELCQARKASEETRVAAIRKEKLESQNSIAGFEKAIELHQIAQRGKSTGSPEYQTAQAEISEARKLIANTKRHLSDLAAAERESVAKLREHEACIDAAHKQLESLKARAAR